MCVLCSAAPNSFRSPGLQPSRRLCPWNFSGKNTRVGCHFLLQGIFLTQGSNLHLLCLPALAGRFFTTVPSGKSILYIIDGLKMKTNMQFLTHYINNNDIIVQTLLKNFFSYSNSQSNGSQVNVNLKKETSPPSLLFCTVTVKNLKHQLSLATSHLHCNTQRRDSGGQQGTRANGMCSEGCFQKPLITRPGLSPLEPFHENHRVH